MYSPRLPTILEWENSRTPFSFPSVVDSGADYCVFPATFGERLGLQVKKGQLTRMSGFGGGGECFYHKVNVVALIDQKILRFECFAGFSEQMNEMGIGLLGRHGFFELFDEIIFDQRNKLFKLNFPETKAQNAS